MSGVDMVKRGLVTVGLPVQTLRQGMQLAVSVLLGYGLAAALGLPERFWVVITVLIVMRSDAGSAIDAGWDRVRGTAIGALAGLLGVYLHHAGANGTAVTLAIVSVLAFGSAALPMLRSSAVAALIVLAAGEIAGHSPLEVALLRVVQIGIGVLVSVAVAQATSQHSTRDRLLAGCATVLRRLALQLQTRGLRAPATEAQAEASALAMRTALQGLAVLAGSADRKFPWSRAKAATPLHGHHHRRIAALTARVVQDAVVLNRGLDLVRASHAGAGERAAIEAVSAALSSVANVLAGTGPASLQALQQLASDCAAGALDDAASRRLLAAPLRFLLDDLQQLCAKS
nr:FUSC family protein [Rhodoferax sp.]